MAMSGGSTPSSSSSNGMGVPRVGGVRCYWALLKPHFPSPDSSTSPLELNFVHPDPVLGVHLARQKMSLMGRGILEFIHPAERSQARRDLANAIAADDLQGSVTRVRFARLSRIREILGGSKDEIEYPVDAATFVEDDEYLILDLVLNWVADGLLLAFFHAIRDKDPVVNNDPSKKTEEWSNFCGTANFGEDQIESLHTAISLGISPPSTTRYPPTRVFQIHTTPSSPTRPGSLIFAWPPPRPPGVLTRFDGLYDALEYTDLMRGVDMDPSQLQRDDTRTNCTTRFGATHSVTTEGVYRVITSVFIPYGSLIFACFQTVKLVDPSPSPRDMKPRTMAPSIPLPLQSQPHPQSQAAHAPVPVPVPVPDNYNLMTPQQEWVSNPQEWHRPTPPTTELDHGRSQKRYKDGYEYEDGYRQTAAHQHQQHHPHPQQNNNNHYPPQPPLPPHPTAYPQPYPPSSHASAQAPLQAPQQVFPEVPYTPSTPQHLQTIPNPHSAPRPHPHPMPMPSAQSLPHLHTHAHAHANPHPHPITHPFAPSHTHTSSADSTPDKSGSGPPAHPSRPLVPPPGEVECCVICGIRESPEWRRNDSGIKDLCNACGLRLARQVAKREGRQKPRKKKEKS